MDLLAYLKAIRKYWWIVVAGMLIGVGLATLVIVRTTPKYVATLSFFVNTSQTTNNALLQGDQYAQQRVASYVILVTQDRMARLVLADPDVNRAMVASGTKLTPTQLSAEISASAQTNTVILNVQVTDTSTARAQQIATALSTQFVKLIGVIDRAVELQLVSGPALNPLAVSPRKTLDLGLGFLVGLAVGLVVAVLRDRFSRGVRSIDGLRSAAGLPVLGEIALDRSAKGSPLVVPGGARSRRIESYRQLRTSLQFVDVDFPVKVILVTSPVSDEGKSTTSSNLAMVFADTGIRVLLVEADLRRPRLAEFFGMERAVGLSNVLAGQVELEEVLQSWGTSDLSILPSGFIPPNPSELLGSASMVKLMATLRTMFDVIILDSPPLLPVTDAVVASAHADGVLLVVRAAKTSRGQIERAIQSLTTVDARVFGTVLNMAPVRPKPGKALNDGYGYG